MTDERQEDCANSPARRPVGDPMKRTAVAVLAAVLAPAIALYGWGREGHRIVGDIAQERLTEVRLR